VYCGTFAGHQRQKVVGVCDRRKGRQMT
jgi:hypothetical protein